MKLRTLISCLILSGGCFDAEAQLLPINNVPTPEIAQLGEYGTIPVSPYTGVPDISIPLYEIHVGDYSLPVTTNYHIASLKANAPSGSLGLGWSLLAGGYITRSVSGMMDELTIQSAGNPLLGYYYNAEKLRGVSDTESFRALSNWIVESNNFEVSADEFSFNFCGYSGTFYYAGDGRWCVASDHDIEVVFDPDDGGFIDPKELGMESGGCKRLNLTNCNIRTSLFFNKFTLITPDGCRYEFGGPHATEFSTSYFHRNTKDLIPTTWRLSKIITPEQRIIEFVYDTESIVCDIRYLPNQLQIIGIATDFSDPNPTIGYNGLTGHLLFPANLSEIRTPNETIRFEYDIDPCFASGFKLGSKSCLGWKRESVKYCRDNVYSGKNDSDPADQFHLFLGYPPGVLESDAVLCDTIASRLKNKIMKSMVVRSASGSFVKSMEFAYCDAYKERRKLVCIRESASLPGEEHFAIGERASPISSARYADRAFRTYRFNYNPCKLPVSLIDPVSDYWGYYNSGEIKVTTLDSLFVPKGTNNNAKADILTEIIYPTGGKCLFEYELHQYSHIVNAARTGLISQTGSNGGLRIASITLKDERDSTVRKTQYHYAESPDESARSSGILREMPTTSVVYREAGSKDKYVKISSQGGVFASVTNQNTPVVGYSCVIEETLDSLNRSQGYVKYRFTNYDTDIYGCAHPDEYADISDLTGDDYTRPYTSRSMERGKLVSKEFYDSDRVLRKKVAYHYAPSDSSYMATAHQNVLYLSSSKWIPIGTLTKTYLYRYLTDSIVETWYTDVGVERNRIQTTRYNANKLPETVETRTGNGPVCRVEYAYSADLPEFRSRHYLSLPIEEKTTLGKNTRQTFWRYGFDGCPYLKSELVAIDDGDPYAHYHVTRHDAWGNPMQIEVNGRSTVCLWGYQGQKLIAKIDNLTYWDFNAHYRPLANGDPDYALIEHVRSLFPAAQFHIYRYDSRMRLQLETRPNGETIGYNYDTTGRLAERYRIEKDDVGNDRKILLNSYDYYYEPQMEEML